MFTQSEDSVTSVALGSSGLGITGEYTYRVAQRSKYKVHSAVVLVCSSKIGHGPCTCTMI